MTTSLRALAGALKTAIDAAQRALGYANQAGQSAASASNSLQGVTTQVNSALVLAGNTSNNASIATTQAGIATTQAGIATQAATDATNQAGIATTQAGLAVAANSIRATAADGVTGGTAVAVGSYYFVPSASALGAFDLYKNVGGVATSQGITVANVAAYLQAVMSSGEQFGTAGYVSNGQSVAGSVYTAASSLLTVPNGVTGAGGFLAPRMTPSAVTMAALVGCTVRLTTQFAASANFITDKAPNPTFYGQVNRTGGLVSLTSANATLVRRTQSGTTLTVEIDYVVTATDLAFGAGYQIIGTAAAVGVVHTLQVQSMAWRVVAAPATSLQTLQDRMLDTRIDAWWNGKGGDNLLTRHFAWGDVLADCTMAPQYANGAVARNNSAGRAVGFTIPTGSTGVNTILQPKLTFDGVTYNGRTVKITWGLDTSAAFARAFTVSMQLNRAAGTINRAATVTNVQNGSRRVITLTYTLQGDETGLQPFLVVTGAGAAVADEWMLQTSFAVEITATTSDVKTPMDETLELFRAKVLTDAQTASTATAVNLAAGLPSTTFTVETAGGDFTTVAAALAALTTTSASNRGQVAVGRGVFPVAEAALGSFKNVEGRGRRETLLQCLQAANTALATITANSGLRITGTATVRHMTVEARNCRYAIHDEGNNVNPDAVHLIESVSLRHYGNADAKAYQQSIGTPAGSNGSYGVWTSTAAYGLGLGSGVQVTVRDSSLVSDEAYAFSFHDNLDWVRPARVLLERCDLSTLNTAAAVGALFAQSFGSNRDSLVEINGCSLNGDLVSYADSGWMPTTLDKQPANHQGFRFIGYGNTPAMFWVSDFGRALRLDSATTGLASKVQLVGGSALSDLFGPRNYQVDGAAGVAGYVYGWSDVAGTIAGTSLGARLGDCTAVNKTLQLAINGGATGTITFAENYTAMDNATVLGKINTLLAGAAVASLFAIGERARPHMQDEEQMLINTSAEAILMGMVLAYDVSDRTVRKMLSTDPASRYAGQAWQDIYPGAQGRVKSKGYVALGRSDTLRDDAAAITAFGTFSVSVANPGRIVVGGTQGLLQVVRPAVADRPAVLRVR